MSKELRRKEIEMQNALIRTGSIKTCTNCEYWSTNWQVDSVVTVEDTPVAGCKKWDVTPPIDVILTGCEDHSDYIPF